MPQTREHKNEDALPFASPTLAATDFPALSNGKASDAVPHTADTHPLAHLAGKYSDEPIWDDFLQAMQEVRRGMNAQEEVKAKVQQETTE